MASILVLIVFTSSSKLTIFWLQICNCLISLLGHSINYWLKSGNILFLIGNFPLQTFYLFFVRINLELNVKLPLWKPWWPGPLSFCFIAAIISSLVGSFGLPPGGPLFLGGPGLVSTSPLKNRRSLKHLKQKNVYCFYLNKSNAVNQYRQGFASRNISRNTGNLKRKLISPFLFYYIFSSDNISCSG